MARVQVHVSIFAGDSLDAQIRICKFLAVTCKVQFLLRSSRTLQLLPCPVLSKKQGFGDYCKKIVMCPLFCGRGREGSFQRERIRDNG